MSDELPFQFDKSLFIIKLGSFSAIDIIPLNEEGSKRLEEALKLAESHQTKGAVNVHIPEKLMQYAVGAVIQNNYTFLTFFEKKYFYYKWLHASIPNRVPEVSIARLGAGGILFSPDEKFICLIYERGVWGRVCGAVDRGETSYNAAIREVKEETGAEVDESYPPLVVGGWQTPHYHPFATSDVHIVFLLRAKSMTLNPDKTEIDDAKWIRVEDVRAVVNGTAGPEFEYMTNNFDWDSRIFLQMYFEHGARPMKTVPYKGQPVLFF